MADKPISTIETARQFLRCDPAAGKLYWLPRPDWAVRCDRIRNSINTRISGAEAGRLSHGYLHVRAKVEGSVVVSDYAHRLIWAMTYGEMPVGYVDHINGNKLDNRIVNLRLATMSENMRNRDGNKDSSSRFCGVAWSKKRQKWLSYIRVPSPTGRGRGKMLNLGAFDEEAQAALAYNQAAVIHHGRFAKINTVPHRAAKRAAQQDR